MHMRDMARSQLSVKSNVGLTLLMLQLKSRIIYCFEITAWQTTGKVQCVLRIWEMEYLPRLLTVQILGIIWICTTVFRRREKDNIDKLLKIYNPGRLKRDYLRGPGASFRRFPNNNCGIQTPNAVKEVGLFAIIYASAVTEWILYCSIITWYHCFSYKLTRLEPIHGQNIIINYTLMD